VTKPWSIQTKLLLWLSTGIVAAGSAASVLVYVLAKDEVDELFDRQLKEIALSLRDQQDLDVLPSPPEVSEEDEDGIVVSAWDRNGRRAIGIGQEISMPSAGPIGFSTGVWAGQAWRSYEVLGNGGIIVASQPVDVRRRVALGIAARIMVPMLALVLALIGVVWFSVRRALKPIAEITDALGHRAPGSLEPVLAEDAPQEVLPFLNALNDLLSRLAQQFAKQTDFLADATHELRTPLTALQLQVDLVQSAKGEHERNAALRSLRGGLQRIIHLASQLLSMARLEHGSPDAAARLTNLSELTVSIVGEFWPLAKAKNIDLGVSTCEAEAWVRGYSEALRIILTNIIDNAIRYTPDGGRVDVALMARDAEVVLEVEDTGPGIAEPEKTRVFDRFYRGIEQTEPGSGLGLALVKSAAKACDADIMLEDGQGKHGLRVRVVLVRALDGTAQTRPTALASVWS
jgi:signal transduction histidine kinase